MRSIVNLVIVMALATQVSHAAWLFNDIGKPNDGTLPWMGWVFALSLEASIFVFTIYEKRNVATFFAVVSTLVNLLYYWIEVSVSHRFFAMLVISPIVPTTIYYYSDLIALLRAREGKDSTQSASGYYSVPAASSQAASVPAESAPVFVASVPQAPEVRVELNPVVRSAQSFQDAKAPVGNGNAKPKRPAAPKSTGAAPETEDWQILDDDSPSDWRERTGV